MNKSRIILLAVFAIILSLTLVKNLISQVKDADGKVYKTVIIGNQEWMAENLNVSHFRNGESIPQVKDDDDWAFLSAGAWCNYENDTKYGKTYGKLYNWYAVNDPRGLAPEGWHIPSEAEWKELYEYLGGMNAAGGKLKAVTIWESPNTGATNETGFNAYPVGSRNGNMRSGRGYFHGDNTSGYFWTSTEDKNQYSGIISYLYYNDSDLRFYSYVKSTGFSVRCIKDN